MFTKKILFSLLCLIHCLGAQAVVPAGTKIRLRLEQTICSTRTDPGQTVELSVASDVRSRGLLVFPEGARALGTILPREAAHPSLLRGVDFSIDRVRATDGAWISVRYTRRPSERREDFRRAGILSAGVVPSLWPSLEPVLLVTGRNVTLQKGAKVEVFTDEDHILSEY